MKHSILILLFFVVACNTPDEKKQTSSVAAIPVVTTNDLTRMSLKGNVRKIHETEFQAQKSKDTLVPGKQMAYSHEWDFNEVGNVTRHRLFDYDDSLSSYELYAYNAEDLLMSSFYKKNQPTDSFPSLYKMIRHEYDENGNKSREYVTNHLGEQAQVLQYQYSVSDTGYSITETGGPKTVRRDFNRKGNNLKSTYLNDDQSVSSVEFYSYDSAGRMIKSLNTDTKEQHTSQYNDHNDRTEFKITDGNGKVTSTRNYTYEYDRNGNYIRKIEYLDGKPYSITERVIDYYK